MKEKDNKEETNKEKVIPFEKRYHGPSVLKNPKGAVLVASVENDLDKIEL